MANGKRVLREWMVYSQVSGKLFCYICKLLDMDSVSRSSFADDGFNDWKNGKVRIRQHETSDAHQKRLSALATLNIESEMMRCLGRDQY
jgi:hypothetical protein